MVSELARLAKEKYLELVKNGIDLTLREFAEKSDEILDQRVSHDSIKHWAAEHGWLAGKKAIQVAGFGSYKESRQIIDKIYPRAISTEDPLELVHLCKAYITLLRDFPEGILIQEEGDRITALASVVSKALLSLGKEGSATVIDRLTKIRQMLRKHLAIDLSIVEERGVDADAMLMGIVDGEEIN